MASGPEDEVGPRSGTRFGPYELRRLLGKGGMGAVYEAYDTVKDRTVAVKLLHERFATTANYQERFRRESRAAARLQEPHVIPIHDWGEIDGVLYIDMRLVTGSDLRAVLNRGHLSPARTVALLSQIAAALDAAHADGLVHRDVKPENILVTANDFCYLVDFGIANNTENSGLTSAGTAVGSYSYMAPERFEGSGVTARADTYALACVMYECMTGVTPFRSSHVSALMLAHMQDNPHPASAVQPGVPLALDAVIARALAKNPADRYASAGEFASAAADALTARPRPPEATRVATSPVFPNSPDFPTAQIPGRPNATQHAWSAPPTNPMPPPGGYPQQPVYPSYEPSPAPRGRSWALLLAVIVAFAALGVAAVLIFDKVRGSDDSARSSTSRSPGSSAEHPTSERATTTLEEEVGLPPGAVPCAPRYGPAAEYSTSARGTDLTSCEFAEEVRIAYADGGAAGESRQVVATSPITGQAYTMSCAASGRLVTCTGGNNAVVYVY